MIFSYEQKAIPIHSRSWFWSTKIPSHHYYQARSFAVRLSKIRQLVLKIWAKNLFPSKPEVDFQRQQFWSSFLSNLNICRLNFEISSISSHDISKKPFPVQTGSRFSATTIFGHHFYQTWTYVVWFSKIRPLFIRLWARNLFPKAISDFQENNSFSCEFCL